MPVVVHAVVAELLRDLHDCLTFCVTSLAPHGASASRSPQGYTVEAASVPAKDGASTERRVSVRLAPGWGPEAAAEALSLAQQSIARYVAVAGSDVSTSCDRDFLTVSWRVS
ncbi:MAG: hypothetical protein KIT11_05595 [Fimbriimonadaceae bacterium]|nr:hypothetical protein [Fimbriimonadaceae bacterium]QYK56633.1 MAG: hypothetical protein KF733_03920 [Fimbriimonadaceae bacterium]